MIAHALHERVIAPGREAAIRSAIELAERGWLADEIVRTGIRSFVRERLAEQERNGMPSARLAELLRTMPIAIETGLANEQHYEVPPGLFARMLGPRLKYSSAWWPAGVSNLAMAEEAMLELTRVRAGVVNGMSVLDLGCGWGSFALWLAARQPDTRITCVSNSTSQKLFIEKRAAERALRNVHVVTADINRLELMARFDRIVSVEMFEHARNYELLLARIRRWLAPDGRLFVHIFCNRGHGYLFDGSGAGNWMGREFFSGGTMPSFDLLDHFQDDLRLENRWWIDGTHYARTAEAWLDNLDANAAELAALLEAAGAPVAGERAVQRWRLFVLACAEMFAYDGGSQWGVGHYLFAAGRT
jgi:cyclopropane-fatty-acyl-phospholipid synthase